MNAPRPAAPTSHHGADRRRAEIPGAVRLWAERRQCPGGVSGDGAAGRSAGPAIVGDYSFSVVTATLLGVIALHGLDVVSLREIAGDLREGATGAARGVQRFVPRRSPSSRSP